MKHTIMVWPDPILRIKSTPVADIDALCRTGIIESLIETNRAALGAGLSAIQIGLPLRVFVLEIEGGPEVYINPSWIPVSNTPILKLGEGCLSIPEQQVDVERYKAIQVEWAGIDGRQHIKVADGLRAQAIQHECEHLDGEIFLDKTDIYHRDQARTRMRKLIKQAQVKGLTAGQLYYGW
jgi:peptide deformylase